MIQINYSVQEQERADRAKASENELRERLFQLEKDFKKEKENMLSNRFNLNLIHLTVQKWHVNINKCRINC